MGDAEEVLAGLDPEQQAAVRAVRGPVCILAGAGTGKTRTITHRIAYGVRTGQLPAQQVLAVTFTARAAGELRGRLRGLGVGGVQARTFHAAALRQLRYFAPRVLGGPMPQLAENKIRLVAQAAARSGLQPDRTTLRDLAAEIEWAKAQLVGPEEYAASSSRREPPADRATVAAVYATYEEAKKRAGVLDFEDLLLVTAYAVEHHRDVAEQIRGQYRYFVVDEYQDVNPLQQRLLDAWLGDRDELCVVGDVNQTIYSFTGADPSYLLDFPARFPGTTVVRLERDYRSTPQVVELANAVLAEARGRIGGARLRLVGQRPPGPQPTVRDFADETAEAVAVAASIRRLLGRGVPAAEVAVLFRVNAQSEAYEKALTDLGIPYLVRGGERFFARPEVREAVLLLRGAARGTSRDTGTDGMRDADPGTDRPEGGTLPEAVGAVRASTGWSAARPPAGGAARERWESLAALVATAVELAEADPGIGLADLVRELDERAAAQHAPTVQGVTLASLHAAKGLEWDAVFLVGLADGTMPIQHAVTDDQVEEERRLLYVGITRARVHLQLSWAAARSPGGRRSRRPSRFLPGPVQAGPQPVRSRRGGRSAAVCRVCGAALTLASERAVRRCASCPSDYDEDLFARLRAWRGEHAAARKVPAYVVFTDATLTAIAQSRPATPAQLLAVPGIGAGKLEQYGAAVLALVRGEQVG